MEDNMSAKAENNSEPVKGNWEFSFIVNNLTEDEADMLLDHITQWVNENHTSYSGGFFLSVDDEVEDKAEDETEDEGVEDGKE